MTAEVTSSAGANYAEWIRSLKDRVRAARQRAALSVNSELILLYWDIGNDIVEKQEKFGWGTKVVEKVSLDLKAEFPGMAGFSRSNLMYMRSFAMAWTRKQIVQAPLGQLPWYHHLALIEKIKSVTDRILYAQLAVEYGWSHDVLVHQIEVGAAKVLQKPETNFKLTLPQNDSELMEQTLKDSYNLSFLQVTDKIKENRLRAKLVDKALKFLLELGAGFAYVGKGVTIDVGGDPFEMDLLFYNLVLHRYFVIELKTGKFDPRDVGQLGFYMTAVDEQVRNKSVDGETVGMLLCKEKNSVVVEYSLKGFSKPLAVATYELEKLGLPSVAELQEGLTKALCAPKSISKSQSKTKVSEVDNLKPTSRFGRLVVPAEKACF